MTSIALVVLDTLRKDSFDKFFDWLPGKRYDNAWSTSHWTVPAHASLFTGRYPSEVGVYSRSNRLDYNEPVLAETLNEAGYRTRGFSANPHIISDFQFDRGFKEFDQHWKGKQNEYNLFSFNDFIKNSEQSLPFSLMSALKECIHGDYDTLPSFQQSTRRLRRRYQLGSQFIDDGASEALRMVEQIDNKSQDFLFLNLMEAHAPWNPPTEYQTIKYPSAGISPPFETKYPNIGNSIEEEAIIKYRQAYQDSVKYLSDIYNKIFRELNDFDYVITLSDHGELLGEHNLVEHSFGTYPELTHIPLVISGPEFKNDRSSAYVNLIDVYETILDIANVENDSGKRSLLSNIDDRSCITEYHGITYESRINKLGEYIDKESIDKYDKPRYGLACAPSYYGYETFDGFISNGEAELLNPKERLSTWKSNIKLERKGVEINADIRKRLRDLGYV